VADRIEVFPIVVPAGTAIGAPQTTALSMVDGHVERIEIIIPPGPSGLVGFRVIHSQQVVIPFSGTAWVIADDEKISWPIQNYPTGNKWSIRAYNTDIYSHTLYFRFHILELVAAIPPYPAPITDL